MEDLNQFIRDVTQVGSITKSEVRSRIKSLLESVVPKGKNVETGEISKKSIMSEKMGYNEAIQQIKDNINSLTK